MVFFWPIRRGVRRWKHFVRLRGARIASMNQRICAERLSHTIHRTIAHSIAFELPYDSMVERFRPSHREMDAQVYELGR